MNSRHLPSRSAAAGFSLIELMVALVAGLVVVGAVLAFTVSSLSANTAYVKSTRLMQELRNTSDHVAGELKRAGYDEAAMDYVANPLLTKVSKFAPILVDSTAGKNCIIYAYDRSPGTAGGIDVANGEIRAIRRETTADGIGVVEVAESTATVTPVCGGDKPDYTQYPATCNTTSGWCPLSDPRVLDITTFTISSAGGTTSSNGLQEINALPGFNAMQLRELRTTLEGALVSDAEVKRKIQSNIKVRADCLRANTSLCTAAPTP